MLIFRVTRMSMTAILILGAMVSLATAAVPQKVRFNEHVRPILSGNCFYCHGPDPKHREADLRLDTREGATADLGGYAAIVPGKPDESALIERVASTDPDVHMPPPASKKPHLTPEQIAILRRWIEQGAQYEGHWAFLPLKKSPPPAVKNESWVRNDIDRFILARLEQEGIAPSPEADPATLIRRVSLDLTGLLPSPEEVEAFVRAYNSPRTTHHSPANEAYTAIVDKFLASPHYAERWGRHWLDQARYADSNGYSIDSERQMWPYRDWVIRALADDMPFDQFTIEQLAGDLLPNPTKGQLVATAFHRNTLINEEGGTDKEQFRHEAVVDRVNTTGAVWLGLTVGCCQCHTHKFDPIPHREYYQLFAFFNNGTDVNNKGATLSVARGELLGDLSAVGNALRGVPAAPTTPNPQRLAARRAAWEKLELARLEKLLAGANQTPVAWSPAKYVEYDTKSNAGFQLQDDNSLLADGKGADNDTYRVVCKSELPQIAAFRLRTLTHPSLPKNGPGLAGNGNFVLTGVTLTAGGKERPIAAALADHEQPNFAVTGAIDDDPKTGWAINVAPGSDGKMNADHQAVFILKEPLPLADQTVEIKLHHELNENYLIGRFAIDFAATAPPQHTPAGEALLAALQLAPDKRTAEQKTLANQAYAKTDAPLAADASAPPSAATKGDVLVWKELAQPRQTFVAIRGDFLRPDKEVGPLMPDVLSALPPKLSPAESRNRLDLARWLVSPENPLTPRVTMNRMWMRYFGRGLVETEEDFGTQGTLPTHPELLDWLAGELHRQRWSLKEMHKLIVTSSTYRQASNFRPDLNDKDPRNLLLARQERLRFDAEVVRDAALSASGLLDRTIGGPSVRPPQPDGVYAFTQTAKKWTADTGPARYRRAIYTTYFRSAPHPLFTTFDAPDFQTVCTRRGRSNTPLQALTVANDVAFVEFAQGLAARVIREAPGNDANARLRRAYLLSLCREPSEAELSILRSYYDRQLTDLAKDPERIKSLATADMVQMDPTADSAALVLVSRAILNTDGFITRE